MTGRSRFSRRAAGLALVLLAAAPARADTIDYLALDDASRQAIGTACHGWVYRDAADQIAPWIDALTPLCAAEEAARARAAVPPAGSQGAGDESGAGASNP